jgi:hypothetical protein
MKEGKMARARDAHAVPIVDLDGPRYVVINLTPPRKARIRRRIRVLLAKAWVRDAVLVGVTLFLVGFLITCLKRAVADSGRPPAPPRVVAR